MSTGPAALVTLVVLSAAGLAPALALVGMRLVTVPLCPLAGAVITALAATADTAVGGGLLAWFVGLALVVGLAVVGTRFRPPSGPARGGGPTTAPDPRVTESTWPTGPPASPGPWPWWPPRPGASGAWPLRRWASTPGRCG